MSSPPLSGGPRVTALGGGHGLAASLAALRRVAGDITAVVTVADNGGSSGRLRREFDVLPPGDLRMALAALCGDDDWGRTWARVLQHRFDSAGEMHGHAVGNLLIVALWELLESGGNGHVAGLDWVARLLRAQGRVLPMATVPLDITARVAGADPASPDAVSEVRGQVEVATTRGRVVEVALEPATPPACAEAVAAVRAADWVVVGPGSWYSSVVPHLLVPELRAALQETDGKLIVNLNLVNQPETEGLTPADHLDALLRHAPDLRLDVVLGDVGLESSTSAEDRARLESATTSYGGRLVLDDVAGSPGQHDPEKLARAYARIMGEHIG